jgi:hypothetical protein
MENISLKDKVSDILEYWENDYDETCDATAISKIEALIKEENQKLKKENDIYKSFICHVKNSFKMINDDISEIDVYRSLRTRADDILNNNFPF